jgi:hypothetical protein
VSSRVPGDKEENGPANLEEIASMKWGMPELLGALGS